MDEKGISEINKSSFLLGKNSKRQHHSTNDVSHETPTSECIQLLQEAISELSYSSAIDLSAIEHLVRVHYSILLRRHSCGKFLERIESRLRAYLISFKRSLILPGHYQRACLRLWYTGQLIEKARKLLNDDSKYTIHTPAQSRLVAKLNRTNSVYHVISLLERYSDATTIDSSTGLLPDPQFYKKARRYWKKSRLARKVRKYKKINSTTPSCPRKNSLDDKYTFLTSLYRHNNLPVAYALIADMLISTSNKDNDFFVPNTELLEKIHEQYTKRKQEIKKIAKLYPELFTSYESWDKYSQSFLPSLSSRLEEIKSLRLHLSNKRTPKSQALRECYKQQELQSLETFFTYILQNWNTKCALYGLHSSKDRPSRFEGLLKSLSPLIKGLATGNVDYRRTNRFFESLENAYRPKTRRLSGPEHLPVNSGVDHTMV